MDTVTLGKAVNNHVLTLFDGGSEIFGKGVGGNHGPLFSPRKLLFVDFFLLGAREYLRTNN